MKNCYVTVNSISIPFLPWYKVLIHLCIQCNKCRTLFGTLMLTHKSNIREKLHFKSQVPLAERLFMPYATTLAKFALLAFPWHYFKWDFLRLALKWMG
ncbi:hypothetical protein CEXT_155181 [Caerostris extrusa]|uniref:Uncharacterized protein n=1 Tax=Caerostris extrusa TaxID=172846 RepID=A0AAV4XDK5_CAEEX|nr:hypothetical protein CEXT_155181 [Caerostris extrusa]